MNPFPLLTVSSAMAGLLIFAAAGADAQQRAGTSVPRISFPSHANHFSWEGGRGGRHGFNGGFGGAFIVEREVPVIVEREVVREVKPAEPPAPPAPPRKPYVIGSSDASLPGSCMKLIDDGVSYYYCGGEWYRQVGDGRSVMYKAVARKL
jgi:hypothetical protein